jgi:gliding motility-associated-like protein
MKALGTLIALLIGIYCRGQCPSKAMLNLKGSACLGTDTLVVSSQNGLSKITWYNGNIMDTTVIGILFRSPIGLTVAGGNGPGAAANQLFSPLSVFLDRDGNMYVADNNNNRVQSFPPGSTSATNGFTVAGGSGQGMAASQLNHPSSVFVDSHGNLYVADEGNHRIQEFPPNSGGGDNGITVAGGNFPGGDSNQLNTPMSIWVDANGYLYIADTYNSRVQRFPPGSTQTTNGVTVAGTNTPGSAANELDLPTSVCVDQYGNVYVSDAGNNRIQKFPPNSTSTTNGVTISSPGSLLNPQGIFIDAIGNIYVADYGHGQVLEFPSGSTGISNGQMAASLTEPVGLFVDGKGDVYATDGQSNRILEFSQADSIDLSRIPRTAGTYTAMVTDNTGCTMATQAIVIHPSLESGIHIAADQTTICAGEPASFGSSTVNAGSSPVYQWRVNDENAGLDSAGLVLSSLRDGDIVSCIMTSSLACTVPVSSTDSIKMIVNPTPTVGFDPDTLVIKPGKSAILNALVGGSVAGYAWIPATGLDDTAKADPVASPVQTTTYTLTATGQDGCQASGKATVIVYYPLNMPNAFTPNGDGRNDVFRVPPSTTLDIRHFSIYNRMGERVFMTDHPNAGWDGVFNGRQQPAGTYVWVLEYRDWLSGKTEMRTGTVLLIR